MEGTPVTDQNPAEPQQTGVHESFGSAPASGSGLGHESAGSAPAPSFAPPAPPVEAPKTAPVESVKAPVVEEAPKAPPVVPAQSSSPVVERTAVERTAVERTAVERTVPAVGTASIPAAPAHAAPAHAAPDEIGVGAGDSAAPAENPSAAEPVKGRAGGVWKWVVSGAVIVAVAVAAIAIIVVRNNHAQDAINAIAVGDCVDSTQYAPELGSIPAKPTVSCDDSKATHKVIGIVDGQSAAALDDDAVCTQWPQTTATIWLGEHDKSGKIYCLADLGR
jgi:hypothetical protein